MFFFTRSLKPPAIAKPVDLFADSCVDLSFKQSNWLKNQLTSPNSLEIKSYFLGGNHFMYCPKVKKLGFG